MAVLAKNAEVSRTKDKVYPGFFLILDEVALVNMEAANVLDTAETPEEAIIQAEHFQYPVVVFRYTEDEDRRVSSGQFYYANFDKVEELYPSLKIDPTLYEEAMNTLDKIWAQDEFEDEDMGGWEPHATAEIREDSSLLRQPLIRTF